MCTHELIRPETAAGKSGERRFKILLFKGTTFTKLVFTGLTARKSGKKLKFLL
jgi:hypothetical protein